MTRRLTTCPHATGWGKENICLKPAVRWFDIGARGRGTRLDDPRVWHRSYPVGYCARHSQGLELVYLEVTLEEAEVMEVHLA